MESTKIHLITFGGGSFAYRRSARRLALQAQASGMFKTVIKVTDKTFPRYCSSAWRQHKNFMLSSQKGFGYWIWKPIIMERRLAEIPIGDLLIYLDAGCELNLVSDVARDRLQEYVRLAKKYGSLAMQLRDLKEREIFPAERRYSKSSLISALGPSEKTIAENQLWGGIIIMENNNSNRNFLQRWQEVAISNSYSLLMDGSDQTEDGDFVGHRHDQSIFSILYKESGKHHILDETDWKPEWKTKGAPYPIWAMRNRTGVYRGEMKVPDIIDRVILWLRYATK